MRGLAFVAVGAGGFVIQIAVLGVLTLTAGWPYLPATAVAVEMAVLHNFWWHGRWTWSDRPLPQQAAVRRLLRYHVTTALTSIAGNVLFTAVLVETAGLPAVVANIAAVGAMAAANFVMADRWVFARGGTAALLVVVALMPVSAAAQDPETIVAWNQFVSRAETELHACSCEPGTPEGTAIDVPGGTIHRWRGSVLARGATLEQVLHALTYPGTPPPQEEVLDARVLSRSGDRLRLYLKLRRSTIVTVTYETEHDVAFRRHSPGLATSRSVATRIREAGGRDHGFLWRLNSYWRYTQQADGVRIDAESLSLSRRVPAAAKWAVSPLIHRIGRESMRRTLEALERFLHEAVAAAGRTSNRLTPTGSRTVRGPSAPPPWWAC